MALRWTLDEYPGTTLKECVRTWMMFAGSWWGFRFKVGVFRTVVIAHQGPGWNMVVELTTYPWWGGLHAPARHVHLPYAITETQKTAGRPLFYSS